MNSTSAAYLRDRNLAILTDRYPNVKFSTSRSNTIFYVSPKSTRRSLRVFIYPNELALLGTEFRCPLFITSPTDTIWNNGMRSPLGDIYTDQSFSQLPFIRVQDGRVRMDVLDDPMDRVIFEIDTNLYVDPVLTDYDLREIHATLVEMDKTILSESTTPAR